MSKQSRSILSVTASRRVQKDDSAQPAFGNKAPFKKPAKPSHRRQLEQHEASLLPFIRGGIEISIQLIDGTRLDNVIPVGFDRYSIGVEYDGFRETIFKSAIARLITPSEA